MYTILIYLVTSLCLCPVFAKAYIPQSYAFVPIVSQYYLLKMIDKRWWYIVLLIIPVIGFFVWIYLSVLICDAFGKKNPFFNIGLCLLPPVFFAALGFGKATYCGNYRYLS